MRLVRVIVAVAFAAILVAPALAQNSSPSPLPIPATASPSAAPATTAAPSESPQPLASPTPQPTPRDSATVAPPSGWPTGSRVASGPFIIMHLWQPPASQGRPDNVVLGFVPLGSAQGVTSRAYGQAVADAVRKMGPPGNVKASKAIKICRGTQDGWYLEDILAFGNLKVRQESVLAAGPHEGFMAAYTRKDGDKPIAAAESAIRTLCVK